MRNPELRTTLVALALLGGAAAAACGARSGLDAPLALGHDAGVTIRDAARGRDAAHVKKKVKDAGIDVAVQHHSPPPPGLDCAEEGVTYIYVIDGTSDLYAFHPDSCDFELVGVINCPDNSSPFSMAVDHRGVAYTVFQDGNLFRVSTKTAICEPTPFVPYQHKVLTFGMAFAANAVDGGVAGETLYVASDSTNDSGLAPRELATIDVDTFVLTPVAPFGKVEGVDVNEAELTGTGTGGLYGFFGLPQPGSNATGPPSYIVKLDEKNAHVLSGVELPDVAEGNGWAFGFWGGDFYTFTAPPEFSSTVVTRYRPSDGSIVQLCGAPDGVIIVGAGVSTCAPQD
jgi:hypothetical protein